MMQASESGKGGWQHAEQIHSSQDGMNGFDGISGGLAGIRDDAALLVRCASVCCIVHCINDCKRPYCELESQAAVLLEVAFCQM